MAYYIAEDGKTVLTYRMRRGAIELNNGRIIREEDLDTTRIFAVDPDENTRMSRDENGFWIFTGINGRTINFRKEG